MTDYKELRKALIERYLLGDGLCAKAEQAIRWLVEERTQPQVPAGADLSLETLQKLCKLMTRLGIATTPSMEAFGAELEGELLCTIRTINDFMDRVMDRANEQPQVPEGYALVDASAVKHLIDGLCEAERDENHNEIRQYRDWLNDMLQASPQTPTELGKAISDAINFGSGFTLDGKHVPLEQVRVGVDLAEGADEAVTAAKMPCGAVVTNVYDAYEAGKKSAPQPQQESKYKFLTEIANHQRFMWLCEDHDSEYDREVQKEILSRMSVMDVGAIIQAVDLALMGEYHLPDGKANLLASPQPTGE